MACYQTRPARLVRFQPAVEGARFHSSTSPCGSLTGHRGVTIVELMVSVALTLIVVLAIVRVFDLLGGNVSESRSILELSAQLRSAATQLQNDLDRLTLRPDPPLDAKSTGGYLEIIEGVRRDFDNDGDGISNPLDPVTNPFVVVSVDAFEEGLAEPQSRVLPQYLSQVGGILGDTDDAWMGTIRSTTEPFRGRLLGTIQESSLAEVAYWVQPVPGPPGAPLGATELAIVRRQMLILPNNQVQQLLVNLGPIGPAQLVDFLQNNDISVRPEFDGTQVRLVANRLADLQLRRNRFAHWPTDLSLLRGVPRASRQATFPDKINRRYLVPSSNMTSVFAQDALAFDVRVFDPLAPVFRPRSRARYVVTPVDAGYFEIANSWSGVALPDSPDSFGAYVDLGYNTRGLDGSLISNQIVSHFSGLPAAKSGLAFQSGTTNYAVNSARVYDTWSTRYERDGVNQFGTYFGGLTDGAADGIDNNGDFVVDNLFETDTAPPYPFALRGLEIVIRLREVSSQQVRQASVVADFVSP